MKSSSRSWLLTAFLLTGCGSVAPGFSSGAPTATCPSGAKWTLGVSESEAMNPGLACRSCHLGENFQGQNPNGEREPGKAYFFMGTAFDAPNVEDLCAAKVPQGAVVEILDLNDVVKETLTVNEVGNFRSSSTVAGFTLPYKARVKVGTKVNAMASPQMNGDCNSCHTASGREGAPGRVFFPQ